MGFRRDLQAWTGGHKADACFGAAMMEPKSRHEPVEPRNEGGGLVMYSTQRTLALVLRKVANVEGPRSWVSRAAII